MLPRWSVLLLRVRNEEASVNMGDKIFLEDGVRGEVTSVGADTYTVLWNTGSECYREMTYMSYVNWAGEGTVVSSPAGRPA